MVHKIFIAKTLTMAGIHSTLNRLLLCTVEGNVFNRMTSQMGKEPKLVKMVLAFWLSLEIAGHRDLIRLVQANDDNSLDLLFEEALLCLECIKPDAIKPADLNDLPYLSALFNKPVNCLLFYNQRQSFYKQYMFYKKTVFGVANDAEANESDTATEQCPYLNEAGDGSTQGTENQARASTLNPYAREFSPEEIPEEARTLHLTFSCGNPLTEQEITDFFNSCFDNLKVVEEVFIEQPPEGILPLFGRVRFNTTMAIPMIMNGHIVAKFMVNRKHLWARLPEPS